MKNSNDFCKIYTCDCDFKLLVVLMYGWSDSIKDEVRQIHFYTSIGGEIMTESKKFKHYKDVIRYYENFDQVKANKIFRRLYNMSSDVAKICSVNL